MPDILDEARALIQCKECPWYKSCVLPVRFTPEDLQRQARAVLPQMEGVPNAEAGMLQFLDNISSMAQNVILEGCPIFIERLRASPKIARELKRMMQSWGMEEEKG